MTTVTGLYYGRQFVSYGEHGSKMMSNLQIPTNLPSLADIDHLKSSGRFPIVDRTLAIILLHDKTPSERRIELETAFWMNVGSASDVNCNEVLNLIRNSYVYENKDAGNARDAWQKTYGLWCMNTYAKLSNNRSLVPLSESLHTADLHKTNKTRTTLLQGIVDLWGVGDCVSTESINAYHFLMNVLHSFEIKNKNDSAFTDLLLAVRNAYKQFDGFPHRENPVDKRIALEMIRERASKTMTEALKDLLFWLNDVSTPNEVATILLSARGSVVPPVLLTKELQLAQVNEDGDFAFPYDTAQDALNNFKSNISAMDLKIRNYLSPALVDDLRISLQEFELFDLDIKISYKFAYATCVDVWIGIDSKKSDNVIGVASTKKIELTIRHKVQQWFVDTDCPILFLFRIHLDYLHAPSLATFHIRNVN